MNCPNCGVFLLSSAKVCDACGAEIISLKQPENNNSNNGGSTGSGQTAAPGSQGVTPSPVRPRYDEPVFQGNSQRLNKRFPDSPVQSVPPTPAPMKPPKQSGGDKSLTVKILIAVVLVVVAIGVSRMTQSKKDSGDASGASGQSQPQQDAAPEQKAAESQPEVAANAEQSVSIVSHSIVKDIQGNDTLVIEYSWTNNSKKETSFMVACMDHVYQNGIECPSYAALVDEVDAQQEMNDIKPGTTYKLKIGYTLQDKTNALVEVTDFLGKKYYLQETIDLGGGEGNPSGASASASETTVKISDMFLSKDYEKKDVLVIKYEVTNGEDRPISFSTFFDDKVYQNGVECSSLAVFCDDVDSNTVLVNIKPGVTTIVEEGYLLNDMSDVEIEVKKLFTDQAYLTEKRAIK